MYQELNDYPFRTIKTAGAILCCEKKDLVSQGLFLICGAPGETRTLTLLPTADFESAASTDSATEACGGAV